MSKRKEINSYGIVIANKGPGMEIKNLRSATITGWVIMGNVSIWDIKHLGRSVVRPVTEEEYIRGGVFANGGSAKDYFLLELGLLGYLGRKCRFVVTYLMYPELRKQDKRWSDEKVRKFKKLAAELSKNK